MRFSSRIHFSYLHNNCIAFNTLGLSITHGRKEIATAPPPATTATHNTKIKQKNLNKYFERTRKKTAEQKL